MPDANTHEKLIGVLSTGLKPVKPVHGFVLQSVIWIGVDGVMAGILSLFADLPDVAARLMAAPDMWLAMTGAVLAAIFGAIAAFQLSLPDRKPWWALLPLPGLALWFSASGLGCLRVVVEMGMYEEIFAEARACLVIILAFSIPLSVALIVMLRRGFSLRPNLTGLVAGITVAGAAVALLSFVHPHDPSVIGIAVHGVGIAMVAIANRITGGRIFNQGP
jgi:hypothetical protein